MGGLGLIWCIACSEVLLLDEEVSEVVQVLVCSLEYPLNAFLILLFVEFLVHLFILVIERDDNIRIKKSLKLLLKKDCKLIHKILTALHHDFNIAVSIALTLIYQLLLLQVLNNIPKK